MSKNWTDEDLKFLKNNYSTMSEKNLANHLAISIGILRYKRMMLNLHRLKPRTSYKDITPERLLNDDLISFYWMGFILADGCFMEGNKFGINLSSKDQLHLERLAAFLNVPNIRTTKAIVKEILGNPVAPYDTVSIAFKSNIVPDIMKKFKLVYRKTYNPPNLSECDFTMDQWVALIIGYIDGDGAIIYNKFYDVYYCKIKIHSSWKDNLQLFLDKVSAAANVGNHVKVRTTSNGLIEVSMQHQIVQYLYKFCLEYQLPYLSRKWDGKNLDLPYRTYLKFAPDTITTIRSSYIKNDDQYGAEALGKKYNVSAKYIKKIINREIWTNVD